MLATLHDQLPAVVRAATMTTTPWAYAYLPETLPAGVAPGLARTFDRFALTRCEQTDQDKCYRFGTAALDEGDVALPTEVWQSFVDALSGAAYRDAMSELTGVPLAGTRRTLSVWEYDTGDWLAPHVDKEDKLVTQIFYLTESWRDGDAGRLLVLATADPSSAVAALPPRLGASAILVRSDSSWHAVEKPAVSGTKRRSLTVTFWR
ncbi:2OG-Fe(II) oxygenase family protein [Actinophytocola glycyrrhizae]|uniref:2OG-Fe(II) oxygenase family protein n=1 Tax=Actinophytocola glycyrrhizae TaxID=2044873 RepID=A0ABV9S952_9PSEU